MDETFQFLDSLAWVSLRTHPAPTITSSSIVQPRRMAPWPIVTRSPITNGLPGSTWHSARSWMFVSAPTVIFSPSARSTELNHTDDRWPLRCDGRTRTGQLRCSPAQSTEATWHACLTRSRRQSRARPGRSTPNARWMAMTPPDDTAHEFSAAWFVAQCQPARAYLPQR